ncbi:Pkinase-domain-containing protein, partial [Meira miltonrushii]
MGILGSPISPMDTLTSNAIGQGIPTTSPAAMQYFAAHPRRQQVHFGNYLLLQTLGEGEFGKVKLGVHKEWGEEVAVKLIKRDKVGTSDGQLQITGPSKDPAKMSKVEKEIRVLKDVRHPNIVRLYEVIESDRYIGIVLEYASGGELFDHILAHKYLKDRDACRLFAQLISGVSYLHQKKIVHRDLKLENLLLDRNRNVIITDFGFANNFENKNDDLMATSCGSPCYAAPELVVQDGLYAGSAVDVWSCGVILYAMLAGYLPFDDDPANPDGDNINLLYKYIMATPLSFPDYIGPQPRDLLCRMLVPDPLKRTTLAGVMAHPWLSPYRDLFKFSVEELERAAIEQQNKKRQVYRQQMIMQQQMQEQQ